MVHLSIWRIGCVGWFSGSDSSTLFREQFSWQGMDCIKWQMGMSQRPNAPMYRHIIKFSLSPSFFTCLFMFHFWLAYLMTVTRECLVWCCCQHNAFGTIQKIVTTISCMFCNRKKAIKEDAYIYRLEHWMNNKAAYIISQVYKSQIYWHS